MSEERSGSHACERLLAQAAAFADPDGLRPGLSRAASLVVVATVVVIVAAMVAAIALPNLVCSVARGKVKRTLSDLRSIGTAVESYQVDRGHYPTLAGPAMPMALLAPVLAPTYIKVLPLRDGWGHALLWQHATPAAAGYSVWSPGKDGRADVLLPPPGATTDFNSDLYFTNTRFSIGPGEGTQE